MGKKSEYYKNIESYRRYYQKNKKRFLERKYLWKEKNPVAYAYNEYKRSAKRRNVFFDISKECFASFYNKPCFYCGDNSKKNGLDRNDNSKGYIEGNIVPCCKKCNLTKLRMRGDTFIKICKSVALFHAADEDLTNR